MSNEDDKQEAIRLWRNDNACFLDGKPAKVIGWNNDFPTVAELHGPLALEWSWASVNRIMSKDRNFKSN